jgi:hypothetical protein
MNWAAWSNLAQACQKVSPLWCLAVLAITAFGVADFAFAAVSVATASAVQKLAVLVLHSALFCRKRFRSAIVVEFLFR